MVHPSGKKRSLISTLFAVVAIGATLVVLAVMRVSSFFRQKYVPIEQLKFPVLVIQPGGIPLFAEWDSTDLQKFPPASTRTPVNGTIIIDSGFNQFTQENVKRQREGDLKWFARFLLPDLRVKYTFDLRRASASGREALLDLIRHAPPFSDNPAEDAGTRASAQQYTTMASLLDALHLYKPIEPAPQATTDPTAPDQSPPAVTKPSASRDPDLPDDPQLYH